MSDSMSIMGVETFAFSKDSVLERLAEGFTFCQG